MRNNPLDIISIIIPIKIVRNKVNFHTNPFSFIFPIHHLHNFSINILIFFRLTSYLLPVTPDISVPIQLKFNLIHFHIHIFHHAVRQNITIIQFTRSRNNNPLTIQYRSLIRNRRFSIIFNRNPFLLFDDIRNFYNHSVVSYNNILRNIFL